MYSLRRKIGLRPLSQYLIPPVGSDAVVLLQPEKNDSVP